MNQIITTFIKPESLLKGLTAGLLIVLTGCAVGPDYIRPAIDMPEQYDAAAQPGVSRPVDNWWATFNDPLLTGYIQEALKANYDIQAAMQRVRHARALRHKEASGFYPGIDASASFTEDRISENSPRFTGAVSSGLFPRDVDYWEAGFDVNWEIDVFGGTRRRVEGAAARIEEEAFLRIELMISVSAEVARNYMELRGNQHKQAILDKQIENEASRIQILQKQHQSGIIPGGRILDAQIRLQELKSLKPTIEADIQAGHYRLSVLMGRRPGDAVSGLDEFRPLPEAAGKVPVGLPSDLLRRRPDIMSSERALAAATADVGVATAEFFPRFFLTGSPGYQSDDFSDLFSSSSSAWVFGPKITWNIFSANQNRAELESAKILKEKAFIEYQDTLNNALEDVENNLVRYAGHARSLGFVKKAMTTRQKDLDIQTIRYKSGLSDALSLIESRLAWLDSRWNHLDGQVRLLTQVVSLYKSLGGGWEHSPDMESVENRAKKI